jgi:hypothetical protein
LFLVQNNTLFESEVTGLESLKSHRRNSRNSSRALSKAFLFLIEASCAAVGANDV